MSSILREIEQFLRTTGMAPATFGKNAIRDPRFVTDLRRYGRTPRPETVKRLQAYMEGYTPG